MQGSDSTLRYEPCFARPATLFHLVIHVNRTYVTNQSRKFPHENFGSHYDFLFNITLSANQMLSLKQLDTASDDIRVINSRPLEVTALSVILSSFVKLSPHKFRD